MVRCRAQHPVSFRFMCFERRKESTCFEGNDRHAYRLKLIVLYMQESSSHIGSKISKTESKQPNYSKSPSMSQSYALDTQRSQNQAHRTPEVINRITLPAHKFMRVIRLCPIPLETPCPVQNLNQSVASSISRRLSSRLLAL